MVLGFWMHRSGRWGSVRVPLSAGARRPPWHVENENRSPSWRCASYVRRAWAAPPVWRRRMSTSYPSRAVPHLGIPIQAQLGIERRLRRGCNVKGVISGAHLRPRFTHSVVGTASPGLHRRQPASSAVGKMRQRPVRSPLRVQRERSLQPQSAASGVAVSWVE
jgi:hypothetical protein